MQKMILPMTEGVLSLCVSMRLFITLERFVCVSFFVLRDSRKEKNDLPIRSRADQVEAVTKKYRRMMRSRCPRTNL